SQALPRQDHYFWRLRLRHELLSGVEWLRLGEQLWPLLRLLVAQCTRRQERNRCHDGGACRGHQHCFETNAAAAVCITAPRVDANRQATLVLCCALRTTRNAMCGRGVASSNKPVRQTNLDREF